MERLEVVVRKEVNIPLDWSSCSQNIFSFERVPAMQFKGDGVMSSEILGGRSGRQAILGRAIPSAK
jgi:hypothetical protein